MNNLAAKPIEYMDKILNSRLKSSVESLPKAHVKIKTKLESNRNTFNKKYVLAKKNNDSSKQYINKSFDQKLLDAEKQLSKLFGNPDLSSEESIENMLSGILRALPSKLKSGLFLKEDSVIQLLKEHFPYRLMKRTGHSSFRHLINNEGAMRVLALSRYTEGEDWQKKYKKLLSNLTIQYFEERNIAYALLLKDTYDKALISSRLSQKPWGMSHNKEIGVISYFGLSKNAKLKTPLLLYSLVFMHYFFEISCTAQYYRYASYSSSRPLGEEVVASINNHADKFEFFHPNIYSENLFWKLALKHFCAIFPIKEMTDFLETLSCGEYYNFKNKTALTSLNIIDHIWRINFSKNRQKYDKDFFVYHFRQNLWHEILKDLLELDNKKMDAIIIQNLGIGDMEFTKKMFLRITD